MNHKFKIGDKAIMRVEPVTIMSILKNGLAYVKPKGSKWSTHVDLSLLRPAYIGTAVIRNTRNGQFRVNLTGKNGEKMYTSEPYTTKAMAMKTARLMKDFELVDKTKIQTK